MATQTTCACYSSSTNLKQCKRCRTVSYCTIACQKKDWRTHKTVCRFTVVDQLQDPTPTDPLALLLATPELKMSPEAHSPTPTSQAMLNTFNVAELRMAIFSLLPAMDLLRAEQVCRSWYHTITTEHELQQRLFLAPGPGKLVFPAKKGMCCEASCHNCNMYDRLTCPCRRRDPPGHPAS